MFVGELAVPHAKHLCYSMSLAGMMVKREIPATVFIIIAVSASR